MERPSLAWLVVPRCASDDDVGRSRGPSARSPIFVALVTFSDASDAALGDVLASRCVEMVEELAEGQAGFAEDLRERLWSEHRFVRHEGHAMRSFEDRHPLAATLVEAGTPKRQHELLGRYCEGRKCHFEGQLCNARAYLHRRDPERPRRRYVPVPVRLAPENTRRVTFLSTTTRR